MFRAPGKLFVAGEYAVLWPGHPAVLMAVDRYATVTIADTAGPTTLTSDLSGGLVLRCERVDGRLAPAEPAAAGPLAFVRSAVDVVERLAAEHGRPGRPFHLSVATDLTAGDGRKLGLGSSAAVTVATCGALARFYDLRLSRADLYRVAMLATLAVTPDTSGGDVAAGAVGGWLLYCAPDRQRSPGLTGDAAWGTVSGALSAPWPELVLRPLPTPRSACLEAGWTGRPASTTGLLGRFRDDPDGSVAGRHRAFLAASTTCVSLLATGLMGGNVGRIQQQIRRARDLLSELDRRASLGWMTPRLRALCEVAEAFGAAAKPSGAGGGDCGIALLRGDQSYVLPELRERWIAAGVQPLALHPHPTQQDTL